MPDHDADLPLSDRLRLLTLVAERRGMGRRAIALIHEAAGRLGELEWAPNEERGQPSRDVCRDGTPLTD